MTDNNNRLNDFVSSLLIPLFFLAGINHKLIIAIRAGDADFAFMFRQAENFFAFFAFYKFMSFSLFKFLILKFEEACNFMPKFEPLCVFCPSFIIVF